MLPRSTPVLALLALAVPASPARPAEERRAQGQPDEAAPERAGDRGAQIHRDPRLEDRQADRRRAMVREQLAAEGIRDARVLAAMTEVPRHRFVPEALRDRAYEPRPLPIGEGQTISQPYVVGFMTEVLRLAPGHRVLEVGTGSGYQAAVAARLAAEVYTMEIFESLAASARRRLAELGVRNVTVRHGDGYHGWPEKGPFDAIIVTCAGGHVPPPLLKQLRPGGRLVMPVGGPYLTQMLVLVEKQEDGTLSERELLPVVFVRLLGH